MKFKAYLCGLQLRLIQQLDYTVLQYLGSSGLPRELSKLSGNSDERRLQRNLVPDSANARRGGGRGKEGCNYYSTTSVNNRFVKVG